jgi:hypothetical protein
MNPVPVDEEKETGNVELRARSRYPGSWQVLKSVMQGWLSNQMFMPMKKLHFHICSDGLEGFLMLRRHLIFFSAFSRAGKSSVYETVICFGIRGSSVVGSTGSIRGIGNT